MSRFNPDEQEVFDGLSRIVVTDGTVTVNAFGAAILLHAMECLSEVRDILRPLDGGKPILFNHLRELAQAERGGAK